MNSLVVFLAMLLVTIASAEVLSCPEETRKAAKEIHSACFNKDNENSKNKAELASCVLNEILGKTNVAAFQKYADACSAAENPIIVKRIECIAELLHQDCPDLKPQRPSDDASEENEE